MKPKTWEIDPARPDGSRLARRFTYRDADDKVVAVETGTVSDAASTTLAVISRVDTTYDSRRYAVRVAQSAGGTVQTLNAASFDDRGQLVCATVRMNLAAFATTPSDACVAGTPGSQGADRITRNIYDAGGQLVQVRKAVGTADGNADATFSYTANGKRQFVIDANGNRAQYVYDGFDRLTQWIFPSTSRPAAYNPGLSSTDAATVLASALGSAGAANAADYEQYGYDANGNRTSLRKRDGSALTYSYDALNRVTTKIVPERSGLNATHTRDVYYGYDVQDRPAYARFDSATGQGVTNTFDGFGRLTGTTLTMDGTWAIGHGYDAHGNVTSTTFPDGNTVQYSYDALDRPTQIQRSGTATVASYSYDTAGRRTAFNGGVNTSYAYDSIGRPTSLSNNPAGNAGLNNAWTFAYNPAGQITTLTRSNDVFAFAGLYNVTRPYTANGLNQYTAAGSATFAYDANGNLTNDGSTSLTYDVENRLVGASGAKTATLRYDPLGRLYEVTGASGTTRFVWDGDAL
ncbi:MAG: RHS repeat protein, partial [Betaproteobacteria bacterium]|nr:RHS repeat protein [Betaproteobacteria bacterium]